MTERYEDDLRQMAASTTPASLGALAQMGAVLIKALREKFEVRDQRIAALESRLAVTQQKLSSATKAIAVLERRNAAR
jgi:hypothetical protein